MSTHNLDVSGARALTTRTNDPASTYASTPAKAGDDIAATISGGRELRLELPENARIQRRSYPQRTLVYEDGKPKKDEKGDYVYEEGEPRIALVLVLAGSATIFQRSSVELFADDDPAKPTYEGTPHTSIVAKRWKEPHYLESGELLDEVELGVALAGSEG